MADLASDKQLQELIYTQLGLQQKSQRLFKDLIKADFHDPLDDIFKSISNKTQEIKNLKKQLLESKEEINKLKKQLGIKTVNIPNSNQQRTASLDRQYSKNQDMELIEGKKKQAKILRDKYSENIQKYIIFLLKCIREVSKSKIERVQDLDNLISSLKQSLQRERDRVIQLLEHKQNNKMQFDKRSQVSTQASRKSQQKLNHLIKQVKQSENKQQTFQKISISLGLQQMWRSYIDKLKDQSKMFYYLKDILLQKSQLPQSANKNEWEQWKRRRGKKQSWKLATERMDQQIKQSLSNIAAEQHIKLLFENTKKQLEQIPKQAYELIKQSMKYMFTRLDQLLIKHNQHPCGISNKPNFLNFKKNLSELMKHNQWQSVLNYVKIEIDECFYYIQRKTKFHSANRMILKNNL